MPRNTRNTRTPWTLKRRLTITVGGLLALAAVLIGLVSVIALRGFLVERLDLQLQQTIERSQAAVRDPNRHQNNHGDPDRAQGALLAPGQQAGTLVAVVTNKTGATAGLLTKNGDIDVIDPTALDRLTEQKLGAKPQSITIAGVGEYRITAVNATGGEKLVIGLPLTEVDAATAQLILVTLVVSGLCLVGTVVAGRALVGLELRPLETVVATATRVSRLPLDRDARGLDGIELPEGDDRTEVGRVGNAVRTMLGHVGKALAARQASEDKVRQFVSDASHELRTPLASIRGYAELTRRSGVKLPKDTAHSLARIESEAARMTDLVEDLLLLARLDEGRELEARPVDLTRTIVDAVSDAHAAGPEHVWRVEIPDKPVTVVGDSARLHQVIVNLLANARVHTPAKTVVTVELVETESGVVVSVTDNGPGIAPDQLATLFERFSRGDSSRTRATGSTGLGLAIVHAVVVAHHGEVDVVSRPGHTVFSITLPRRSADR